MKSFILALGVFLSISVAIVLLTVRDIRCAEALVKDAETLADTEKPDAYLSKAFAAKWEKERKFLSFSTNHQELERVDEALSRVLGAVEAEDLSLYRQATVMLVRATEHLYCGLVPAWEHII